MDPGGAGLLRQAGDQLFHLLAHQHHHVGQLVHHHHDVGQRLQGLGRQIRVLRMQGIEDRLPGRLGFLR